MAKYRVEARLICLSDGKAWEPHAIEFDTEVEARGIVRGRFESIRNVFLRMISKREGLPNPDNYPLATRQFPECPDAPARTPEGTCA